MQLRRRSRPPLQRNQSFSSHTYVLLRSSRFHLGATSTYVPLCISCPPRSSYFRTRPFRLSWAQSGVELKIRSWTVFESVRDRKQWKPPRLPNVCRTHEVNGYFTAMGARCPQKFRIAQDAQVVQSLAKQVSWSPKHPTLISPAFTSNIEKTIFEREEICVYPSSGYGPLWRSRMP